MIRDAIDGVFVLEKRCKVIIDTLFPEMSVAVANEYELIVRRVVKYMLPAKYVPTVLFATISQAQAKLLIGFSK